MKLACVLKIFSHGYYFDSGKLGENFEATICVLVVLGAFFFLIEFLFNKYICLCVCDTLGTIQDSIMVLNKAPHRIDSKTVLGLLQSCYLTLEVSSFNFLFMTIFFFNKYWSIFGNTALCRRMWLMMNCIIKSSYTIVICVRTLLLFPGFDYLYLYHGTIPR